MPHSIPTVNWVDFPPGGGLCRSHPLGEVVAAVAETDCGAIGLDDVSVGVDGIAPAAELLRVHQLACTDIGVLRVGDGGASSASPRWLAQLAEATGARLCIGSLYAGRADDGVVRELERAADVLSAAGVRLALEFAPYSPLDSPAATVALCDRVGWERCGVLLDTWHFCASGAPWAELRALRPEQIALVHLSDAPEPASGDLRHESRFRRLPPGAGTLPLRELVATLRAIGYAGVVSAEVLSAEIRAMPPAEGARCLAQALREAWPS